MGCADQDTCNPAWPRAHGDQRSSLETTKTLVLHRSIVGIWPDVGKPLEFAEDGKANAMVAKDKPQNTIRVLARMRGVRSNRDLFLIRTGNPNAWLAR
jgi:hypothetical protein